MSGNLLAQVIGHDAFQALAVHAGGTDYRVPTSLDCPTGRQLTAWIGNQAADALIRYAGGDVVYVQRGAVSEREAREADILKMHQAGMTPAEIAREYRYEARLSERSVWSILARRMYREAI